MKNVTVKPLFGNVNTGNLENVNKMSPMQLEDKKSGFSPIPGKALQSGISINQLKLIDELSTPIGILNYGQELMNQINNKSDSLMEYVKDDDNKVISDQLRNILTISKKLSIGATKQENSNFVGGLISKIKSTFVDVKESFLSEYNDLPKQIDRVIVDIDQSKGRIVQKLELLDDMYNSNLDDYHKLDDLIKDIKLVFEHYKSEQARYSESNDLLEIENYNRLDQQLKRFDQKIMNLEKLQMIAIQSIPGIRDIQNNGFTVLEKFEVIKTMVIPQWKRTMAKYMASVEMLNGATTANMIDDENNALMIKSSDMDKNTKIKTAKLGQRDVIDTATLEHVHNNLISSFEEVLKIENEGQISRNESREKLDEMKNLYRNMSVRK